MELIKRITNQKIHVIGDIHGELDALKSLVSKLGYKDDHHPDGYQMVFVGDLVDRGPDSVGVIRFVKQLVESNLAHMVLGNHELMLLINRPIDGSGWFFDNYPIQRKYMPYIKATQADREMIVDFLKDMPVAIYNDSMGIVHAQWCQESIDELALKQGSFESVIDAAHYYGKKLWQSEVNKNILKEYAKVAQTGVLTKKNKNPGLIQVVVDYDLLTNQNALFNITAGKTIPLKNEEVFWGGDSWRFVDRDLWWNRYDGEREVVFGHYWRARSYKEDLGFGYNFSDVAPDKMLGPKEKAYCIDFSVGARFLERDFYHKKNVAGQTALAAYDAVNKKVIFDDGSVMPIH